VPFYESYFISKAETMAVQKRANRKNSGTGMEEGTNSLFFQMHKARSSSKLSKRTRAKPPLPRLHQGRYCEIVQSLFDATGCVNYCWACGNRLKGGELNGAGGGFNSMRR
jgi:hypothetical protein